MVYYKRKKETMTIDEIIKTNTLQEWLNKFNWQGGTIHQVKQEVKRRLYLKGIRENNQGLLEVIKLGY
jgi:uncharacterized protein YnzC (UPF0291/DUF896 family)